MSSWDLHVTSSSHRIKIYSINTSRAETRRRMALMRQHGVAGRRGQRRYPFHPIFSSGKNSRSFMGIDGLSGGLVIELRCDAARECTGDDVSILVDMKEKTRTIQDQW